jgi:Ca2+-binding EF-hand superfamily protein
MLGYESERRLKNLLVAVGEGERDLEAARQRLCEIRDFAPLSAFERIDRDMSGQVDSFELINFLRDNSCYHVSESEAFNLVQFFDSNGNNRLSYQEFLQIVLPCENNVLRHITLDRPSRRITRYDHLPRDIELSITNILEKEVDLARRLEVLKRELEVQYDYSPYAAFRSVDRYNSGRVDTVNTGSFLRQNGHYASELELLAIIRRIDTDGDAHVDYNEFAEFIRVTVPAPRPPYNPPPRVPSSPVRTSNSPLRASSPIRTSSPVRTSSPMRASVSPSRLSPSRKPVLPLPEEDDLVHALKELCDLEGELERAKQNLAMKSDFNITDAFNIFDQARYGSVSVYDIQSGLNAIGVYPTFEECELFVLRWDKNGDRRLSYSEFSEAFLAHDSYYAGMVNRRGSNYVPRVIRRDDVFLPNTSFEFQSMWRTHFRVETANEYLRKRLASRPGFNMYEAFNSLDFNDTGAFSAYELKRMIESRGYFVGYKEVEHVVAKMDKNRDGRVAFTELGDELHVRSSPERR